EVHERRADDRRARERRVDEHLDLHPPPVARPAVSLLHRDPPLSPTTFFFHREIVFLVTISLVVGLVIAAAVDQGSSLDVVDHPVAQWVADIRTPLLTDLFNAGSRLGDNAVVFALAFVLA